MIRIKNNLGWLAILVLSFLPIFFWIATKSINTRFVSSTATLTSLGQITGLVGMAMFAIVLILSGRFKFLEDYFGGLNKIYLAHHLFGGVAFVLMLFHPLFLAGKYLFVSTKSAALFLLPSSDWPVNFGIFGLLFLIIFLVITFFIKLPYEKWKLSHKFLGFAFFLVGLHSFLIPSDISRSLPLRIYILSIAGIGLLVYVYRTILGFILVKKFTYVVQDIKYLDEKVVEIELSPQDKTLHFKPGQFAFVSFQSQDIGFETHPFSFTSSPFDRNLKIAVKNLGDFTAKLKNLKSGTIAKIEGPFGRFLSQNFKDQIWIAGGIGITPFLSMARTLKERGGKTLFIFFISRPMRMKQYFLKSFQKLPATLKILEYSHFILIFKDLLTRSTSKI